MLHYQSTSKFGLEFCRVCCLTELDYYIGDARTLDVCKSAAHLFSPRLTLILAFVECSYKRDSAIVLDNALRHDYMAPICSVWAAPDLSPVNRSTERLGFPVK